MMSAEQDAGDWSDAPSPDLVISLLTKHRISAEIDVGAGRFRSTSTPGEFWSSLQVVAQRFSSMARTASGL
jgi:hypothetical protein